MNTGQTLLSVGAVVLLGMTVLMTNRTSLQHGTIINSTEVGIYAVSLAQAKIEEAAGKAFDTYSSSDTAGNGNVITALSQLTPYNKLGIESGEVYPNFDDFDDYNYFSGNNPYKMWVDGVDSFYVQTSVCYVDTTAPDVPVNYSTWSKRMTVKVWPSVSPWATGKPDTVTMKYIYTYWWFR
jgi:hypothetical protein